MSAAGSRELHVNLRFIYIRW